MEVERLTTKVAGLQISSRRPATRLSWVYVHGVPTASWDWLPFLERIGGVAPDLPARELGQAGGPILDRGYDRFLEAFAQSAGLERLTLVVHDWGGPGRRSRSAFRADRAARAVHLRAAAAGLPLAPYRARLAHTASG